MKHINFLFMLLAAVLLNSTTAFADETHYLWVGESQTLNGTNSLKDKNGNWCSAYGHTWTFENENDKDKLELNIEGSTCTVTAKKFFVGPVKITCSSKYDGFGASTVFYYGLSHTDNFYILCNQVDISLSSSFLTMSIGDQENLQWEFNPATSNPAAMVSFTSEKPEIATVDAGGHIVALSPGTTIITAKTNYETSATCAVQVTPIMVMLVSLNKTATNLSVGGTEYLVANIFPDNATYKSIKWTSSDPNVVAVSSNGQILGRAPGIATITASTTDGSNLSATCEVTVGESGQTNVRGDLNNDGIVDVTDVDQLIDIVLGR